MLNHDRRGWRDFETMSGRKQGPNALAPDAQMLCRIPAHHREQVPIPLLEEETEGQESHSSLPHSGKSF